MARSRQSHISLPSIVFQIPAFLFLSPSLTLLSFVCVLRLKKHSQNSPSKEKSYKMCGSLVQGDSIHHSNLRSRDHQINVKFCRRNFFVAEHPCFFHTLLFSSDQSYRRQVCGRFLFLINGNLHPQKKGMNSPKRSKHTALLKYSLQYCGYMIKNKTITCRPHTSQYKNHTCENFQSHSAFSSHQCSLLTE